MNPQTPGQPSNLSNDPEPEWLLPTTRLVIRRAVPNPQDIALLLAIWTNPAVMANVGFPLGLKTDAAAIERQLRRQKAGEFDCVLIATLWATTEPIGECKLGSPDSTGIAHTDIKLLPKFWGNGYGREIKLALLGYLFTHTACTQVRATPNRGNVASIRMQESVGGRRTGEGVYRFPEKMRAFTAEVPYFEYTVFRDDWSRPGGLPFRAG
jgi:RimJ/RimL family protein N-acetyltransferase